MSEILKGKVKWFNDAKGFGFVEHTSGRDVFVHYSVIESEGFKTLKDGQEVSYTLQDGEKGLHAAKVFVEKKSESSKSTLSQQIEKSIDTTKKESIDTFTAQHQEEVKKENQFS